MSANTTATSQSETRSESGAGAGDASVLHSRHSPYSHLTGGHGSRRTSDQDMDPVQGLEKELMQLSVAVDAAQMRRKRAEQEKERLKEEVAAMKRQVAQQNKLTDQMRAECDRWHPVIQTLESTLAANKRTEMDLQTEVLRADQQTRDLKIRGQELDQYLSSGEPALLLQQLVQRQQELMLTIREQQVLKEQREAERARIRAKAAAAAEDKWSTTQLPGGDSTGRVSEAEAELEFQSEFDDVLGLD